MNKHNMKLFLISSTVALILLTIVSINFSKAFNSKEHIENFKTSIYLSINISKVIHELQKERGLSSGYINSHGVNFVEKLQKQIKLTNNQVKNLKDFIKENNYNLNEELKSVLQNINFLKSKRVNISILSNESELSLQYYTMIIKKLIDINIAIFKTREYSTISDKLISYSNFLLLKEDAAIERKIGTSILSKDFMNLNDKKMFSNIIQSQKYYEKKFLEHSSSTIKNIYLNKFNKPEIHQIQNIRDIILNSYEIGGFNVSSTKWFDEATLKMNQLKDIENYILKNVRIKTKKIKDEFTLVVVLSKLLDAIQNERGTTAGYIGSHDEKFKNLLNQNRVITNNVLKMFNQEVTKNSNNSNKMLTKILLDIQNDLMNIDKVRDDVDNFRNKDNSVINYYKSINQSSLELVSKVLKDTKTTSELRDLGALYNIMIIKELLGLERAILSNAFARNKFFTGYKTKFIKLVTEQEVYLKNFFMCADDNFIKYYHKKYSISSDKKINAFRQIAKNTIYVGGFNQDPSNWFRLSTIKINNLKDIEDSIIKEIIDSIDQELSDVEYNSNMYIIIGIFILIFGGAGILFFISKENKYKEAITSNNNKLKLLVAEKTKSLNNQKRELEHLVDSFDKNVIFSKTDTKGILTHVSEAFCTISGYTKSELLGKPHNIVRHPDMSKEAFSEIWGSIQNNACWFGEVKNRRKDGSTYWVYSRIEPDYDEDGNVFGYYAVRQEISAQKEVEKLTITLESKVEERTEALRKLALELEQKVEDQIKELREKDSSLLEQSKMASMGELIGNIAHQWRQPLSAISTTASGMHLNSQLGILTMDEIPKYLDTILSKAKFLSETINTFMNFMDKDTETKEVVIQDRIDNALEIVKSSYDDNSIDIINNINYDNPIKKNMIPGELPQVVINILNNSKDVLSLKDLDKKWIKIDLSQTKNNVIITIEDNGGGISDEILPKIFEPYFTTKHQSQGTGLGLNICYKIVTENLKGKLYAKNTANGAKFYIELPLD